MSVINLPDADDVVRHVRKRLLRRDEDGNVLGALPEAFQLREAEEYLSITWLQHFSSDYEIGLIAAAQAITNQLGVKKGDAFTTGCVGKVKELCKQRDIRVRILHEGKNKKNPGYSSLRGLPRDNLDLLMLLAEDVFRDTRPAAAVIRFF